MKKTAESVLKSARENNEPVFVLRAKDRCARYAIASYLDACEQQGCDDNHMVGVNAILEDFSMFAIKNTEKLKTPDSP